MLNDSGRTLLAAILVAIFVLPLSGCMSVFHGFGIDDPPFEGTKLGLIMIEDFVSGGDWTEEWNIGTFMFFTIDLPFSFVADTVRLPFDLVEMSKYPKYHGRVLHGTTGKAMNNLVVMAATKGIEGRSSLTPEGWRQQLRQLRIYGMDGNVNHRINGQDYACVATRTNSNGEFVFQLSGGQSMYFSGVVAFKEGYKDAWQRRRGKGGFKKSDGTHDVEIPALYLNPEAQ